MIFKINIRASKIPYHEPCHTVIAPALVLAEFADNLIKLPQTLFDVSDSNAMLNFIQNVIIMCMLSKDDTTFIDQTDNFASTSYL